MHLPQNKHLLIGIMYCSPFSLHLLWAKLCIMLIALPWGKYAFNSTYVQREESLNFFIRCILMFIKWLRINRKEALNLAKLAYFLHTDAHPKIRRRQMWLQTITYTMDPEANMLCTKFWQPLIDFVCHYKISNERKSEVVTEFTGVRYWLQASVVLIEVLIFGRLSV